MEGAHAARVDAAQAAVCEDETDGHERPPNRKRPHRIDEYTLSKTRCGLGPSSGAG